MMKKALLSLLLAFVCLPVVFGQTDADRAFVTQTVSSCDPYTWIDGEEYAATTVVTYITDDTIYVLDFTRLSLVVDTNSTRSVTGGCMASWNGKNWPTEGIFYDTVATTGTGCDTLVKIEVTLTGVDEIETDTVVCGSYTAPWGDVYTASRSFDTTIVGTCNMTAYFTLTVNPEYRDTEVTEVTGGCTYEWLGLTITDTGMYVRGLQTVEHQCDSIVRLRVTAYSGEQDDSYDIVACDSYQPTWSSAITASGTYTHDTVYGTYYINPVLSGNCTHHETYNVTIVTSVTDSANVEPAEITAGCSYTWAGHTYTDNDVHYHLFTSVIGGCDSMAGIHVTYTGHNYDTTYAEYCGDAYNWKTSCPNLPLPGANSLYRYTADTTVTVTVDDTASGCTTHYTLALTFFTKKDTVSQYYCGQEYAYTYKRFNTSTNTWQNATTTFTVGGYHSVSADGQDSLISVASGSNCKTYRTLNLNLNIPEQRFRADTIDTSACESFRFKADRRYGRWITYTASADEDVVHEEHSQNNLNRCYDSIVHLKLVIYHNSYIERTATACDSYTWEEFDGNTYTSSGTYRDTLDVRTEQGCLQIGRLTLTINTTPIIDIQGDWVLEPGQSTTLKASPTPTSDDIRDYRWYINDTLRSSTDSLELENVQQNIDIRLLSTSVKNCTAENWITVTANVGIDEAEALQVNVYPNPASRYLNVESATAMSAVVVYNAAGQQVVVSNVNGNKTVLDLGGLAAGSYTLRIVGADGNTSVRKFIVNK